MDDGTIGLAQQNPATRTIHLGARTNGTLVDVSGTARVRRVTSVAASTAGSDALNVAQLIAAETRVDACVADLPVASSNASGFGHTASTASGGLALGHGAVVSAARAVALGNGAVADQSDTLSVGPVGAERRIVNDAAGSLATGSTDAISGGKLFNSNVQFAAALGGGARFDGVSGTWTGSSYNLATSDHGPGTMAAMQGQIGGLSAQVSSLGQHAAATRGEARQGVAAAMAMTSASMPSLPGKTSWTLNSSTFRGEWAGGVALAHRLDTNVPIALTAGYSFSQANQQGARAGPAGEFYALPVRSKC
ncbi:hypothetical protein [Methylobacterium iners]|uniref:hypothetical protein n=1 Tax=Methylobacterium iners TaxID=418707 RepID=UPI001EE1E0EC|nr:hypothetical protein [Methylobacterium iners]